jgi:putative membrane protein
MAVDGEGQVPERKHVSGDEARSHLAGERTLLAWWRSGLAALAVSLAVGRVIPALIDESKGWFVALGVGFAVLAMAFTLYGTSRQRQVDRAIAGGDFHPLDGKVVFLLTALMALLAVTTIVLVLAAV